MTALEAIELARRHGCSPDQLQAVVAAADAELAYRYACVAEAADLRPLEPLVLASSQPRLIYDFAVVAGERGLDVARLQDAIIRSGDGGLMILFAADVPGADLDAFEDAIGRHPDPKYAYLFELEMRHKGRY